MQVYALDENLLISAGSADKGKNYLCPECFGTARVKQGGQRQSHFFHLNPNASCRQSQKGLIHLRLQRFIHYLYPDSEMEKAFPQIGRIADVADENSKIVFEVQYSPISLEEVKQRCQDYESVGFQVVWILHDHTFNKKKLLPSEPFLRSKTCYFSNMDEEGNGIIYDQLEKIVGKRRVLTSHRRRISLRDSRPLPQHFRWPKELDIRAQTWPLYHKDDLVDLALRKKFFPPRRLERRHFTMQLKEAYLALLYILLERSSR